ncbi:MAG: DUF2232 domain-containing protein [Magnetococcales bacterium]|nr:DUF2232 domain-containing protein [Magnetococcales bacterium]NGZ05588.1 DUF2232 domain-containing protein [Magnetococcales bacterium]
MTALGWITNPVVAGTQALVLMVLPMVVPLLLPLQLFAPLPVLLTALWGGSRSAWIGTAIPVVGATLLGDGLRFPVSAFLFYFGFPVLAARMVRMGWRVTHCMGLAFLLGVGGMLLFFVWTLAMGIDFQADVAMKLEAFKANVLASVAKNGGDAVLLADVRSALEPILALMALLLPGFVVAAWFLLQVSNLLAARSLVMQWGGSGLFQSEDLTEWRLPFVLVWVVIGAMVPTYALTGFVHVLGANLVLVVAVLYFMQGMAIVQAFFRHYAVTGVLRGLFYVALFLWHHVTLLVTALGLFDVWVDFRHRFVRTPKEGGGDPPGS